MVYKVRTIASKLLEAESTGIAISPIVKDLDQVTVDEAYEIQLENIKEKVKQGRRIIGKKIGLTSEAVQEMLGVDEPDFGHLMDDMLIETNEIIDMTSLIQPKIEGEIAFVLKNELVGPNVTVQDVLEATDYILPALEIVDSRIKDWDISLIDTIADNASSSRIVLGEKKTSIKDLYLPSIHMELLKNQIIVTSGKGEAALGNPAICVAWLANRLHDYGVTLKAGEVILSGALSGMVVVEKNTTYTAKFDCLGEVAIQFK